MGSRLEFGARVRVGVRVRGRARVRVEAYYLGVWHVAVVDLGHLEVSLDLPFKKTRRAVPSATWLVRG